MPPFISSALSPSALRPLSYHPPCLVAVTEDKNKDIRQPRTSIDRFTVVFFSPPQVNGEYGSASYHGLDGLRAEFKRVSNDSEETHERIDAGFTLLKWLNRGTMFASRILDNLEVRHDSCLVEFFPF
jgi:hypothetical protein